MPRKSPLDKVLGKLEDLDEVNLSNLVQRLARERKLLETVFDVIRDGILGHRSKWYYHLFKSTREKINWFKA